ncbi:E3 ubiquitin-protein ligase TRIM47-like [Gadus macrocephalus]|uniref:E3 ubiquitin-protein ligase TRIM47-like n=1 Tax=Gadus macrocephalus TaxID=80720 RepID=UPI0028CB90D6|nr:E3 ubiquitin-protein ligase TRIM47-like [Gadus macrocephalus]
MSGVPDCCICLRGLTRPVSLPCHHAFCLACIGEYWRITGCCQCPLCKALFPTRPDLKPPPAHHPLPPVEGRPPEPLEAGEVPCDACPAGGRATAAVMSCLVCLASYCPLHLEPHYLDAAPRRHRLVSALKNFEGPCRHHGRSVDRFCRTDRTRICTMCADTDHRDHRIVPLSKEAARAKNTRRSLTLPTRRSGGDLIEVKGLEEAGGLGEAEGLLRDQEQETLDLQQRKTDLEELSQMADPLSFLLVCLNPSLSTSKIYQLFIITDLLRMVTQFLFLFPEISTEVLTVNTRK